MYISGPMVSASVASFSTAPYGVNREAGAASVFAFASSPPLAASNKVQAHADRQQDPFQKLEGMLLSNLLDLFVPDSSFGGEKPDLASEYWRSILVSELSGVLSASGGIGIAQIVRNGVTGPDVKMDAGGLHD